VLEYFLLVDNLDGNIVASLCVSGKLDLGKSAFSESATNLIFTHARAHALHAHSCKGRLSSKACVYVGKCMEWFCFFLRSTSCCKIPAWCFILENAKKQGSIKNKGAKNNAEFAKEKPKKGPLMLNSILNLFKKILKIQFKQKSKKINEI